MSKLRIETVDKGERVMVSDDTACDTDVQTRFHIPRPSSNPPPPPSSRKPSPSYDDVPTVKMLRPPLMPRF